MSEFRVRVGGGGLTSNTDHLLSALDKFIFDHSSTRKISYEILYSKDIKLKKMTPSTYVDWLLDCDAHLIATHVHQGVQ
jgi:hypothetical protein